MIGAGFGSEGSPATESGGGEDGRTDRLPANGPDGARGFGERRSASRHVVDEDGRALDQTRRRSRSYGERAPEVLCALPMRETDLVNDASLVAQGRKDVRGVP